jgi:hypothetical protein
MESELVSLGYRDRGCKTAVGVDDNGNVLFNVNVFIIGASRSTVAADNCCKRRPVLVQALWCDFGSFPYCMG